MNAEDRAETNTTLRSRIFAAVWGAAFLAAVYALQPVLVPLIVALLIAYVLAPVVRLMSTRRVAGRVLPRWGAIVILYAVIVAVLVLTVREVVPRIASQVRDFIHDEVPRIREEAATDWLPKVRSIRERFVPPAARATAATSAQERREISVQPRAGGGYDVSLPTDGVQVERRGEHDYRITTARASPEEHRDEVEIWLDRLRELGEGHTDLLMRVGGGIVGGIIGGIFRFFITLMLSAYLLLTAGRIVAFLDSLIHPAWRAGFRELRHRIDRGLSGVVRGQLVICVLNGCLSAVGFALARLPYWPLLAALAAVFSLIPIFGSILSSIPAVAVGLRFGIPRGAFVLVWILGVHQLEANVLNPKIMGDAAKINPILVVMSLLAGEHFFGILGALLAVPTMSIVQSVFLHWRKYALNYGDAVMPGETVAPPPPNGPNEAEPERG